MPTPEQHALLSASSSHRWLNCPPSARLAEQFPESTSPYAEAGRLAHEIAELKARKHFLEPMSTRTFNDRMKKLKEDPAYEKAMDANTDTYLECLKMIAMSFDHAPHVALETRLDFSQYAPEGFGTADAILIGEGRLVVVDYKNGAGVPVEAENNTQMMCYGLGALLLYAPIFGASIEMVELYIVQPNAGGIKNWKISVKDLQLWGTEFLAPTAQQAFAGEGDCCAGDWCRFCPAKAQCSARAAQMLGLEPIATPGGSGETVSPSIMTDTQIGEALARGRALVAWVTDLEEYALAASLKGQQIAGFKVVEGRGSREWADTDKAFATLQQRGINEAVLYERKPVSVAGLEKILGKKPFAEAAEDLVVKKPGKPALVPESDPRKPYNAAAIAFGVV